MIDPEMILDFIVSWMTAPPSIGIHQVGYRWPANTPEVFISFPSLGSIALAVLLTMFVYLLMLRILGNPQDPKRNGLCDSCSHYQPNLDPWGCFAEISTTGPVGRFFIWLHGCLGYVPKKP